jgi:prevent-host-death family protein
MAIKDLMRSANIAELRDRLTQYLREVRAGQEIIIRDRQRPIAKIVPLSLDNDTDEATLVADGLMRKAQRPLPAAFWRRRRAAVTVRVAAAAISKDRTDR